MITTVRGDIKLLLEVSPRNEVHVVAGCGRNDTKRVQTDSKSFTYCGVMDFNIYAD